MKEVRFFYAPYAAITHELPEEEAQHAVRVLRLDAGDEIMLMDGNGSFYLAEITVATKKRCFYQLKETLPQPRQWQGHLHLAMAPTKNLDRVEWLAEKATEIGFDELTFLNCKFSERKVLKTERIDKIALHDRIHVADKKKRVFLLGRYCLKSEKSSLVFQIPVLLFEHTDLIQQMAYTVTDLVLTAVGQVGDLFDALLPLLHQSKRSPSA